MLASSSVDKPNIIKNEPKSGGDIEKCEDFTDFILKNNVFNLQKLTKNGTKTGRGTKFYKDNEVTFNSLMAKHKTDNLLESFLLEFKIIERKLCVCGARNKFSQRKKDYFEYCSKKCAGLSLNEKRKNTYLTRYGVDHPMKNADVKKKRQQTNVKLYGVDNVFQVEAVKNKIKETNLGRYGVEYSSQRPEFFEMTSATCLERYGVPHQMQSAEVQNKRNSTLVRKYGDATHQPISNKSDLTCDFIMKNFVDEDNFIVINDVLNYYSCSSNFWVTKIKPMLPEYVKVKQYKKFEQQVIIKFIQELYARSVIQDDRDTLNGLELDIFLPDIKLAIEYNGIPYHSYGISDFGPFNNIKHEDRDRHLTKTEKCEQLGITLFQIYEDEWKNDIKNDILRSMISNKLGKNKRTYARKCEVRELSSTTYRNFCEVNHLQGSARASVKIGLYHLEELVACMSFGKPRFNRNYEWELIRACSKKYLTVVGGFSKLLKQFTNKYSGDIITYANRSYSSGDVYVKNGFTELGNSPPNYKYLKLNSFDVVSRYEAQKHKLSNIIENFDNSLTEKQNMINNGYRILWDSGNKAFEYKN